MARKTALGRKRQGRSLQAHSGLAALARLAAGRRRELSRSLRGGCLPSRTSPPQPWAPRCSVRGGLAKQEVTGGPKQRGCQNMGPFCSMHVTTSSTTPPPPGHRSALRSPVTLYLVAHAHTARHGWQPGGSLSKRILTPGQVSPLLPLSPSRGEHRLTRMRSRQPGLPSRNC